MKKFYICALSLLTAQMASAQCVPVFDPFPDDTISANGSCNAVYNYALPTYSGCPNSTLVQTSGLASGASFPVGITTNTFEVYTDGTVLFEEDFADNSAGWTLGTEWQIGSALPSACGGLSDPSVDNTPTSDNGIAGVVLGGCASTALHPYYYITSPVINTAGSTSLSLEFYRWLNSDYTPYMQNSIEVFDGNSWQIVWQSGPSPEITANSWTLFSYDISAYSNANLQVRWGHTIGSGGAYNRGSWNIDDVAIVSGPAPTGAIISNSVTVNLPSTENFAQICQGSSYTFGGQTLDVSGIYYDTIVGAAPGGCDSVIVLNLTVLDTNLVTIAASICEGDTYPLGSQTLNTSGIYSELFVNAQGCDSLVVVDLNVISLPVITIVTVGDEMLGNDGTIDLTITAGPGYTVLWSNGAVSDDLSGLSAGTYTVTVTDASGNCSTSETIVVGSQVSVNELNQFAANLYPNPTKGTARIDLATAQEKITVYVYNVSGNLIETKEFSNIQSFEVELNGNSGFYHLEIRNESDKVSRFKVLKL